ncbi:heparin lyase I family protein [Actinomycetospora cinnamomea]|uniref:Polysaccharide lyase-like protein n=1 Tax=Actinomycetospora cinnamomea TaxID=663609 RepID=A0A2U1EVD4_9PSEU|nr:heparin lyase I family protein [Actinomycetospora cinnamomea]PVZ03904.1 polysaccharide lyase-like protein [Actinomycetospora cinnamomea]
MTDVVTHADPTPPGDGRRSTRRHRQLGLRVPSGGAHGVAAHRAPATSPATSPATTPPTAPSPDPRGDAGPRHRRAPGTEPIAVPTAVPSAVPSAVPTTTGEIRRHRAAHPGEAFDPTTGAIPTAGRTTSPTPRSVPRSHAVGERTPGRGAHRAAEPVTPPPAPPAGPPAARPAGHRTAAAAPTAAASPTAAVGAPTPSTAPAAPRRTVPLRATIGLLGVGGVAAVVALTTPGAPPPAPTPADVPPQLAAPAGNASAVLPSPPPVRPSPLPAPPLAAATPTSEEPQPVIGALFDAATGPFSDLFDNSGDAGLVEGAARPRVVDNPDDPGRSAWQFSVPAGGKRSEVLPQGPGTEPQDGDEQYVRYTAILDEDFPTDTRSWQLILQWHHNSPTGSPPLALEVREGQLMMASGEDELQAIGPVAPGDRIDLTMHVKFSQDPGESSVTVWRDGRPTGVTGWSPREGTMSTEGAYLKMGLYRDPKIDQAGSILVTDLKIGRDARGIGGIGPRAGV